MNKNNLPDEKTLTVHVERQAADTLKSKISAKGLYIQQFMNTLLKEVVANEKLFEKVAKITPCGKYAKKMRDK